MADSDMTFDRYEVSGWDQRLAKMHPRAIGTVGSRDGDWVLWEDVEKLEQVVRKIQEVAAKRATSDNPDFEIDQGNYDDTFWNGVEEGEIIFARELLKMIEG